MKIKYQRSYIINLPINNTLLYFGDYLYLISINKAKLLKALLFLDGLNKKGEK